jgi:HAD superfamily hydrolase (TIGR01490 family)
MTALKPRLALFDLDHTLLEGDSDVLWCDYLMEQGVLDRAAFEERNAAMEREYRAGSVSAQAFSAFYISTLAGRTPAQWENTRQAFLRDVVAPRISAAARALVHRQQDEGAVVVMTTATNRYITELTAQALSIEHLIATDCELADTGPLAGCFTGAPVGTLNMREGKVTRLHAWLAGRGQQLADFDSWGWSDSINDLPLLQAVEHPVATHPDAKLARVAAERGWPVLHLHGRQAPSQ